VPVPLIGPSSAAFNPDAALEPGPDDSVDLRDADTERLDVFGEPLFPPPSQRSATPGTSGELAVPDRITVVLHFRIGSPLHHTRPRKNLPGPSPILYSWSEDNFDVLCHKIRRKVADIPQIVNVTWKSNSLPHLQPYHTATALQYISLDSSTCNGSLRKAWIKEFRRTNNQDVVCNVYVYLQENQLVPTAAGSTSTATPATQQFRRATQGRIMTQTAIIQQQEDLQHLGPIETAHLARTTARLPPSSLPIAIPPTNTFRQMRHLDQQSASLRQRQAQTAEAEQQIHKILPVKIAGIPIEVQIRVSDLRAFLGLPDMNLNGLENFQEAEINGPQDDIEDEDHAESDQD
jgi:hypothetical protein